MKNYVKVLSMFSRKENKKFDLKKKKKKKKKNFF